MTNQLELEGSPIRQGIRSPHRNIIRRKRHAFDHAMFQHSCGQTQIHIQYCVSKAMSDGSMTVAFALVMTMPARLVRSIGLPTDRRQICILSLSYCRTSSIAPDRQSKFSTLLYASLTSVQPVALTSDGVRQRAGKLE
jgi:hypothetical protein